jgi:predicted DNA-binding protein
MRKLKAFRLNEQLIKALKKIAFQMKTSETEIVSKAIECYLAEYVEYQEAKNRFDDHADEIISADEMWRRLDA